MRRAITSTLFILLHVLRGQSQSHIAETLQFESLPDTLKTVIRNEISDLVQKDTLIGSFSYVKGGITRRYTYKIHISGTELLGFYTYYRDCSNCAISHDFAYIRATALYCCKDRLHNPKETAKTREEILAIQKRKGCTKVGVCIL